jgi:diaminopimelate decarboxylase
MRMGGGAKQFGIDAEDAPRLLRPGAQLGLTVLGFHIFSGSQSLKAEAIIEAQAQTIALALRLAGQRAIPVRQLNIGGGFGIPVFPGRGRARPGADRRAPGAALPRVRPALPKRRWRSNWGATWWARPASTWRA